MVRLETFDVVAAWAAIEAAVQPLDDETVGCEQAAGRVLRQVVRVDRDQPPFDRAAMDGFAVRCGDVATASPTAPVALRVDGDSTPGAPYAGDSQSGAAIRIMTGAPVPAGFEAVVPVESTSGFEGERVLIRAAMRPGEHVTPRGRERRGGDEWLQPGRRLSAADVGALTLVGCTQIRVGRRPRVAVLSTGNELVPHHEVPDTVHIRNSNGPMLAALAAPRASEIVSLGAVADVQRSIEAAVGRGLECDLLLTSGGVSMGLYDWVGKALVQRGVRLHFERVALQPGKPTTFGTHAGGAVVALPGNPVSAFTTFRLFASVVMRRQEGEEQARPWFGSALARFEWERRHAKWLVLPAVRRDVEGVELVPYAGSGDLLALGAADCQVVLPPSLEKVRPGDRVPIWPLETWA